MSPVGVLELPAPDATLVRRHSTLCRATRGPATANGATRRSAGRRPVFHVARSPPVPTRRGAGPSCGCGVARAPGRHRRRERIRGANGSSCQRALRAGRGPARMLSGHPPWRRVPGSGRWPDSTNATVAITTTVVVTYTPSAPISAHQVLMAATAHSAPTTTSGDTTNTARRTMRRQESSGGPGASAGVGEGPTHAEESCDAGVVAGTGVGRCRRARAAAYAVAAVMSACRARRTSSRPVRSA
jgi:hypothetical protein